MRDSKSENHARTPGESAKTKDRLDMEVNYLELRFSTPADRGGEKNLQG
jgi:hypothetical protein